MLGGRAVVTTLLLGVLTVGCAQSGPVPEQPAPEVATSAPAGEPRALPVYFVADTPAGPRLYREFHRVRTADPGSDAVREMLRGALDPDYRTLWPTGTTLRAPVRAAAGVISVDLSREASGPFQGGSEFAALTVQQLVYTVQAALGSTDPVRLLVDGRPGSELFGAVSTAAPIARADQYTVRSLMQIDSPAEGATVGPTFTVSGEAAAFEANVPWELLRDGAVVQRGFTSSAEGQRFAPFSFTVTAPRPGRYVVRVVEDDPSDGEGRKPLSDDKTITVS